MPESGSDASTQGKSLSVEFGFLPVPRRVRYDPKSPPHFGVGMNLLLGLTATSAAANLYYTQPLLIELANDFGLTYDKVARIPTLSQAGFAIGLVSICPLGDLLRRRQLIIGVVFTAASFSIGLAVTSNLIAFEVLSFFVAMFSVVTQVIVPLVIDLAPPRWRASAISVIFAGITLGTLLSRVISGAVGQYVTWRVAFYISVGAQYALCVALYWVLPDYPAKNKDERYLNILATMAKYAVTEPTLVQAVLINVVSSACTSSFWVTLTFLLGDAPYNYSTLTIGLFGLIGIVGLLMSPFVGWSIDKLTPWYGILIADTALLATYALQTGAIGLHVSVVVIICISVDIFRQTQNVSLASHVLALEPNARARLNSVLIMSLFLGSVMGTAVGSKVYTQAGWRAAGALSIAWSAFALVVLLSRGPHVPRYTWFGWQGGYKPVRRHHKDTEGPSEKEAGPEGHGGGAPEDGPGEVQEVRKRSTEVSSLSVQEKESPKDVASRDGDDIV